MERKIIGLFFVVLLLGLFFPLVSLADGQYQIKQDSTVYTVEYKGLVPCGKCLEVVSQLRPPARAIDERCGATKGQPADRIFLYCQFCHFFVMIDGIFDFVLLYIVPPVAVLMLVVGGIMFYFAGGRPELVSKGKSLIVSVVIGLFLAYGAYIIVGLVLAALGAASVNPVNQIFENGVISINCPITLPP